MPSIFGTISKVLTSEPKKPQQTPKPPPKKRRTIVVTAISEPTRDAVHKSYIPRFLFDPPFGHPRDTTLSTVYQRHLARNSGYFIMAKHTIIDNVASVPWDIVPIEGREDEFFDKNGKLTPAREKEKAHIKDFLNNPNDSHERFEDVFVRMPLSDVLEIGEGVWVKQFDTKEQMVGVVCRDAATFAKNPDIFGSYEHREDIIVGKQIVNASDGQVYNELTQIPMLSARRLSAYFQYGWLTGQIPVPFGRREVVWLSKNLRTDEIYPLSPIAVIHREIQAMIYAVENCLEYFNDNNVPKGFFTMKGATQEDTDAFRNQWSFNMRVRDTYGLIKKISNLVPISNQDVEYNPIELTPEQLQLVNQQKWYAKIIWGVLGVPPAELGFTEDAKGQSSQIVQNKLVFRKRAVNPYLRIIDGAINLGILPEFGYDGWRFKYLVEDLDEERNRAEIDDIRAKSGLRTINELRAKDGLEEVKWGEDPPKNWSTSESVVNVGNFGDKEKEALKPKDERKLPKPKEPGESLKDKDKKAAAIKKKRIKALGLDSPMLLSENQELGGHKPLKRVILNFFKNFKKEILDLIKQALDKGDVKLKSISEVKGLEAILGMIERPADVEGLRLIVYEIMRRNFYRGWNVAENDLNLDLPIDWDAVNFLSEYTFDRIQEMSVEVVNDIRRELMTAVIEGEGIPKITKRITKVFDMTKARAATIARTETNRASNRGRYEAYEEGGGPGKKKWISSRDARTSEICKRLDGKEIPFKKAFTDSKTGWSGQTPPAHPNCRSTWAFIAE